MGFAICPKGTEVHGYPELFGKSVPDFGLVAESAAILPATNRKSVFVATTVHLLVLRADRKVTSTKLIRTFFTQKGESRRAIQFALVTEANKDRRKRQFLREQAVQMR